MEGNAAAAPSISIIDFGSGTIQLWRRYCTDDGLYKSSSRLLRAQRRNVWTSNVGCEEGELIFCF